MRYAWSDRNRKGQALMEYVLLIALVATCLVAILGLTRRAANDAYARTSVRLNPVAGLGGSSGGSWHPSTSSNGGDPAPADADSTGGGSADSGGDPAESDGPVSAYSSGAH
jgi:Flp pilus assembly pilin Flp